jgi:hypothetical protein
MHSNEKKAFYIVLVIAIIVIIYLFWKKNQETTYIYQQFKPNLVNNPPTISPPTISPPTINCPTRAEFDNLMSELQQINVKFRQQLNDLQQQLAPHINQQISPQLKNILNQKLSSIIGIINNIFVKFNSKIADMEQRCLTQNQRTHINQLLQTFDQDITMFNQIISPFTTAKVILIKIPSIPSMPTPPVQYSPTNINCHGYFTSNGDYCIDDTSDTQACYQVAVDDKNSKDWFQMVNMEKCQGKPLCSDVANTC